MKRIKLILAAVLILIPCFVITGCGESSETNEKYGIICTSDDKLETIKDIMEVQDKKEVSGQTYYLGRIEDKNVAVVRCGSGKVNAALATQILIDKFGATRLIEVENAYTCDDNVKAGDVVEIAFGEKTVKVEITAIMDTTKKENAAEMYRYL